eukprot:5555361-Lingulodinium_polyedra.AAC.1
MRAEADAELGARILSCAITDGHLVRPNPDKALAVQLALQRLGGGRHATGPLHPHGACPAG